MATEYEMTPAVRAELAMVGMTPAQEAKVAQMLENEYWRGHMDGEAGVML